MESNATKGQIEDTIAKQVTKFYAKTLGVGPKQTRAYILQDMVIVRLQGLLPLEEKLLEGVHGIELVKNIRQALHEVLTKRLRTLIKTITGHSVISSHSDVSIRRGERLEVFILDTNYEAEITKPDVKPR